ncbi:MAG: recombinase family protein [Candidatus Solibacter sp.]|jgi:DNA invertase Pin-like site-specific DNA recombinase
MIETAQKVSAAHLKRNAYLYVRQSTPQQVLEHAESTARQYALRQRAAALGWPAEQIVVIDSDLGQSGAFAAGRDGFQKLVAEVSLGHAGLVLGLEVSRLARNCAEWHRLLELCAYSDTLILDEDGIYNPAQFNDRLLLGLKGTMSEAELHILHARMQGGLLNKARRGDLAIPLPIGFLYDAASRVVLDPDQQVQQSIRLLFDTFLRLGSAVAAVREFRKQGLRFPRRRCGGLTPQLLWGELPYSYARSILHNPRYAGAYVYGRSRYRRKPDGGTVTTNLPQDQWQILLRDAHPGYISWEQYQENQQRLRENEQVRGIDHRSPAREGPALLQGLALCGRCGDPMLVRYHMCRQQRVPYYECTRHTHQRGEPPCQVIHGGGIDAAISKLLVETMTPLALEVALSVQQEIQSRVEDADRLRRTQVERARYEVQLAQRRYLQVDPDNRLVAGALEADWNNKLRALADAEQEYERQRQADTARVDAQQREQILALASDFPRLWQDPNTPDRERKRMARLLLEDVTLTKGKEITLGVRFKGGATSVLTVPLPHPYWELHRLDPAVIQEIERLLDQHTEAEIAAMLNARGLRTGYDLSFNAIGIQHALRTHGIKSRRQRLQESGLLTSEEMAAMLHTSPTMIWYWRCHGVLQGEAYGTNRFLYHRPSPELVKEFQTREPHREVQYAT